MSPRVFGALMGVAVGAVVLVTLALLDEAARDTVGAVVGAGWIAAGAAWAAGRLYDWVFPQRQR